jgi:hypothetical protein
VAWSQGKSRLKDSKIRAGFIDSMYDKEGNACMSELSCRQALLSAVSYPELLYRPVVACRFNTRQGLISLPPIERCIPCVTGTDTMNRFKALCRQNPRIGAASDALRIGICQVYLRAIIGYSQGFGCRLCDEVIRLCVEDVWLTNCLAAT